MKKAIIFDLDGTLLNTIEDIADTVNVLLQKLNCPTQSLEAITSFVGDGVFELMERALPEGKKNKAQWMVDNFSNQYAKCWKNKTKPYNGVIELLSKLKQKGHLLAILSNKPHDFTVEMVEYFFAGTFEFIQGAVNHLPLKPDPALANMLLSKLNVKPTETAFIGDSDIDIFTAKNANMQAVGVTWGFRSKQQLIEAGAEVLIDDAMQILEKI